MGFDQPLDLGGIHRHDFLLTAARTAAQFRRRNYGDLGSQTITVPAGNWRITSSGTDGGARDHYGSGSSKGADVRKGIVGVIFRIGSFCRVAGIIAVLTVSGSALAQQKQKAPPPPPVPTPYTEVRSSCASEIKGTCAGVAPGSAESVLCLRRNFAVHSPPCQAALQRAGIPSLKPAAADTKPEGPKGTADAPRRVTTDRVAPPAAPQEPLKELKVPNLRPTQEARFVNRNCREDHSLLCQGVPFGQVLKCLASQQARLSSDCRNAISRR
jgi:hypothetical protein